MVVDGWSNDTAQPRLNMLLGYVQFLMQQKGRKDDVPAAIDRYRVALVAARGEGTGQMAAVLNLRMTFERDHGELNHAILTTQELLALAESLAGKTSEAGATSR